ncbi:MAG: hypothetical protein Q7N87_00465 [Candidatus Uhrbacteria bacterium]|nr:hypothetical protein [Candidatus Uhrbacteria bacterium]
MRKTPVTLGVLSIIFGALTMLSDASNLITSAIITSATVRSNTMHALPPSITFQWSRDPSPFLILIVHFLLATALLIIGIRLVQRALWARKAAIVWGVTALFYVAISVIVSVITLPRIAALWDAFYASSTPSGYQPGLGIVFATSMVIWVALFQIPYPVVLLILLGRKSSVNDFIAKAKS